MHIRQHSKEVGMACIIAFVRTIVSLPDAGKNLTFRFFLTACIFLLSFSFLSINLNAQSGEPVIDMHLMAGLASANGEAPAAICAPPKEAPPLTQPDKWTELYTAGFKDPDCDDAIWGPETDEDLMAQTLDVIRRHNITGVASGTYTDTYAQMAPDKIMRGLSFNFTTAYLSPEKAREFLSSGKYKVFGEVCIQSSGISPSDSIFQSYAAIAEELDIPMGIRITPGAPGSIFLASLGKYNEKVNNPNALDGLLAKHPKLRIYVMHAAWPYVDEMISLMQKYPEVYISLGVICYAIPRAEFYAAVKKFMDAGLEKRVMFASDQMNWPKAIEVGIEAINSAGFLTDEQKRDILYNNAARFLKLNGAEEQNIMK
jgi:predicted TIM-barrel fold metal-dependent hydrolase